MKYVSIALESGLSSPHSPSNPILPSSWKARWKQGPCVCSRPRLKGPERYAGLEGADLIVEIVSDSSVKKDLERLPPLYAAAGVPELWLVDARGENLRFDILELQEGHYAPIAADAEGWIRSPRLGRLFRLVRQRKARAGAWCYRLEVRETLPSS